MTVVFKTPPNDVFTMKTVEEKNWKEDHRKIFKLVSFFEEFREKGALSCLCQHLQGLELMVGFQMILKSLESQVADDIFYLAAVIFL